MSSVLYIENPYGRYQYLWDFEIPKLLHHTRGLVSHIHQTDCMQHQLGEVNHYLIKKWSCINFHFQFNTRISYNPYTWHMSHVTYLFVYFSYLIKTPKVEEIGTTCTYKYNDIYNIPMNHIKYTKTIEDNTNIDVHSLYSPSWQGSTTRKMCLSNDFC